MATRPNVEVSSEQSRELSEFLRQEMKTLPSLSIEKMLTPLVSSKQSKSHLSTLDKLTAETATGDASFSMMYIQQNTLENSIALQTVLNKVAGKFTHGEYEQMILAELKEIATVTSFMPPTTPTTQDGSNLPRGDYLPSISLKIFESTANDPSYSGRTPSTYMYPTKCLGTLWNSLASILLKSQSRMPIA